AEVQKMNSEQRATARDFLYILSCRKAAPRPADVHGRVPREILTVPKRAGTYMLFRAPLKEALQEHDLTPDEGSDTDVGDGESRLPGAHREWFGQQRAVEDNIARTLKAAGPLVLYVHGFNTKPGEALRAGVALQKILDHHSVGATVVVFTWPSAGHLADYFPDQKSAGRFGSYAFVNLLMSMRRNLSASIP